jgi:hypothetical protein
MPVRTGGNTVITLARPQPADVPEDAVLVVRNVHSGQCGSPPRLASDPKGKIYVAQFTDGSGDQWVLKIDPEAEKAIVVGGDTGWDNKFDLADVLSGECLVAAEVHLWIEACWMAATGEWLNDPDD